MPYLNQCINCILESSPGTPVHRLRMYSLH
ncbi:hypothetical protein KGM_211887B, partial [Danaus plexippus plexippus]